MGTQTGRCYTKSGSVEKYEGSLTLSGVGTLTEPDTDGNYSVSYDGYDASSTATSITSTTNYYGQLKTFYWAPSINIAGIIFTVKIEIDNSSFSDFQKTIKSASDRIILLNQTIDTLNLCFGFYDLNIDFNTMNICVTEDTVSIESSNYGTLYPVMLNVTGTLNTKHKLTVANTVHTLIREKNNYSIYVDANYTTENAYLSFYEDDIIQYGQYDYFGTMVPDHVITLNFYCLSSPSVLKVTVDFTSSAQIQNNTIILYIYYTNPSYVVNYTFTVTVLLLGTTNSGSKYRSTNTYNIKNSSPHQVTINYAGMKTIASSITNVTWSPSSLPSDVTKITYETEAT